MSIIRLKRGLAESWKTIDPVLAPGEAGVEIDTGQIKIGDGVSSYNGLPYVGSGSQALQLHIDSLTPHPVYDDGPSFTLIYENAKV